MYPSYEGVNVLAIQKTNVLFKYPSEKADTCSAVRIILLCLMVISGRVHVIKYSVVNGIRIRIHRLFT